MNCKMGELHQPCYDLSYLVQNFWRSVNKLKAFNRYMQVRSKQFKDSICYTCKSIISHSKFNNLTRLCCNRKVVANVQLFFTFAMVCEHWVNAVFTIFALRANIMQLKKLHLSKYEQSLSNVVFTFHLLRFCYGCKSVFSCSVINLPTDLHTHLAIYPFTLSAHPTTTV